MGRHADAGARRRIAAWPIVVAVVVLLVAALTVGYFVILDKNKNVAACTGDTVLQVTASPGAARAVSDAAAGFSATKPVARSTCVSVAVSVTTGSVAAAALAAGWKNQPTPAPALWVVDSASDVASVDASNSAMTAGHTNSSLAVSPVVLAVRAAPTGGTTWASLGAGTGTAMVLGLPDPVTNRASSYALESLVAASTKGADSAAHPNGKAVDAAAVTGASALLARLAFAAPTPSATTAAALTALDAGQAAFTAVPVMESELAAFNAANPPGLTAVYPSGPTAHDEIMAVPLTATWVTAAMSDAAAAFDAYLGDPAGIAILTKDDLRTGAAPASAPGVDLRTTVTVLPEAKLAVRAALHTAWSTARTAVPSSSTPTTPASSTSATTTSPPASTVPRSSLSLSGPPTISPPAAPTTAPTSSTTPRSTPPTTPTTVERSSTSKASTAPSTPASQVAPVITLVLDTSGSMDTVQDGQQRIAWMREGVRAALETNPLDSYGLWSFSTRDGAAGYRKLVPVGVLTEQIDGGTRSAVVAATLTGLFPGGDSWTYGAIQAAYTDAVNGAIAGRPNKVIVVTDGIDTTPSLSRAVLEAGIAALAAQNKNVRLDIIGLSGEVNGAAMTEIARTGGGTFTPLGSLSDLTPTLRTLTSTG